MSGEAPDWRELHGKDSQLDAAVAELLKQLDRPARNDRWFALNDYANRFCTSRPVMWRAGESAPTELRTPAPCVRPQRSSRRGRGAGDAPRAPMRRGCRRARAAPLARRGTRRPVRAPRGVARASPAGRPAQRRTPAVPARSTRRICHPTTAAGCDGPQPAARPRRDRGHARESTCREACVHRSGWPPRCHP